MAQSDRDSTEPTAVPDDPVRNPDWSPWILLLIIPVVLPLVTGIFNTATPKLWGIPAFYWIQLAFVLMSAILTGVVYIKTRKS